jgi:hypothetical protein
MFINLKYIYKNGILGSKPKYIYILANLNTKRLAKRKTTSWIQFLNLHNT